MAEVHVLEPEPERPFYTVESLARKLTISVRTVRNWVEDGDLPSYKFGRSRRIDPDDVDSFLERRRDDRRAA